MIRLLALDCDAPESIQPAVIVLGPRLWALSAVAANPSFCRHSVYTVQKRQRRIASLERQLTSLQTN
jgi:hypothetical protein